MIRRELNPALEVSGLLITMYDERTRLAQDVEAELREHFPEMVFETVIPRSVRVAEAPSYGLPVTEHAPSSRGAVAYRALAKELAEPWLAATKRGIGRGLAAILPETERERAGELRELPVELIKPNPNQPRTKFDPEALAGARLLDRDQRRRPAAARPPPARRQLRAGRRRAPLARRAAGRPGEGPGRRPRPGRAERLQAALIENMVREDLNPVEEARPAPPWSRTSGSDERGAGAPGRPQPPRRLQPDPPARASRRGARAARVRRAQRGPRPRPARRRGQRRPPPPRPRRRPGRLVGPRDREQGSSWLASQRRRERSARPIPRRPRPCATPPTPRGGPRATRSRSSRRARRSPPSCASTTSTRRSPWPRSSADGAPERTPMAASSAAAIIAISGRLAQLVRARL